MSDTVLLDLPDELLIRCLAGSGGMAIGAATVACKRLHGLTTRLKQLPVFSSALSTHASLQYAIKDAAQRALIGCYGAVDFALLFVANYGSARGKKYSDPTDLGHAVEMLREALGQDVVIVGCACAGLMGVGADSQPVEVDPLAVHARGRRAAAARKRQGKAALPTKGVSVLLGKLPPGCVARAFAQDVTTGAASWGPSTLPSGVTLPPQAAGTPLEWSWPLFDEAISLTSSQAAELMQQLQATPTAAVAAAQQPGSSCIDDRQNAVQAPAVPAAPTGECPAAAAGTSADIAECQGLQRLSVAAAAAAESESAASPPDGVQLVPHMCLLLYDNMLQSFGYTESHDMSLALKYMAARDIKVVGGASSGAGDLFFSPGAQASRLSSEPPTSPHIVGLMLCTAQAPAGATLQQALSSAAACAAGMNAVPAGPSAASVPADMPQTTLTGSAAAAASTVGSEDSARVLHTAAVRCREVVQSSSALQTAVLAALGTGPDRSAALFTDARVSLDSQATMNADTIWMCIKVDACAVAAASAAGTDSKAGQEPAAAPADAAPSSAASPVRRSARLASSSGAAASAAGASMTPMGQLLADLDAAVPVDDDDSDVDPPYLAVWVCPKGHTPTAFTGEEAQSVVVELKAVVELDAGLGVNVYLAASRASCEALKQMISQPEPGSSICMQLVAAKGEACAASVHQGLSQLLPLVSGSSGSTATATAGAGGAMHECYTALQQAAAASGCRSGLQAVAVCSCTGRGQQLYSGEEDQEQGKSGAAYGEVCEAGLIDALAGGSVPFVGVYVSGELGPEVHNMCKGWYKPGQRPLAPAEMQGFTSMFAAWGCPPGSV